MNEPQILKQNKISKENLNKKETQITNEPQILK